MKKIAVLLSCCILLTTSACAMKRAADPVVTAPSAASADLSNDTLGSTTIPAPVTGTFSSDALLDDGGSVRKKGEAGAGDRLETVYFAYDSHLLSSPARSSLQESAQLLKRNPDLMVILAGHCDERGSEMYNIALGEKRADAAKEYLVNLGIDSGRLETVSYGEERPAATGVGEESWALNRRVEFM